MNTYLIGLICFCLGIIIGVLIDLFNAEMAWGTLRKVTREYVELQKRYKELICRLGLDN